MTTSTRINSQVDSDLRRLADGKRWGRWIEYQLKATIEEAAPSLHERLTSAIATENSAIDLFDRTPISLRLTPEFRAHIDDLAADVGSQTAVVLRHLLHLACENLQATKPAPE